MDPRIGTRTSLRDFLHILFKRRREIIFFFLTTVIVVTMRTFMVKPTYEAMSQVLVKIGRRIFTCRRFRQAPARTRSSASTGGADQLGDRDPESLALLRKVAETLGPASIYHDLENQESWLTK